MVVAALTDNGPAGVWADRLLRSDSLAAPHLMVVEAANIIRNSALAGELSQEAATAAHADLLALPVGLYPYAPLGDRVWQLRNTVSLYDAWYVALAEALEASLATLDLRLTRAPGPRCHFVTP